jgi:hypothetical protein
MALDYGLLGEDGAAHRKKNLKAAGVAFCAIAACAMLGAFIGGLNTSSEVASDASGTALLSMGAGVPVTKAKAGLAARPRLGGGAVSLRSIATSPVAKLAIKAMDVNDHLNRRDISVQAAKEEMASGWDLVEPKTRERLLKVIEPIEYKASALAGVSAPMNFFDPLGFCTTVTAGKLLFYREVELKHGRVAMLASLGIVVGENYHPLFGGNIDSPAIYAFQETPLQTFWPAVLAALAILETFSVFTFQDPVAGGEQWAIREDHEPGNLGFDPLGLKPKDQKELIEMKTKELNNGRLAMFAVAGMVAQEMVTGTKLFP